MGSIALILFSISILIFQISCKKEAQAQNGTTSLRQLNLVVFKKVSSSDVREIWTSNYDGSNTNRINIVLPNGVVFSDDMQPKLSPDGQKIFFEAGASTQTKISGDLYTCNFDGSGVIKIVDRAGGNINNGGAY